MESMTTKRRSRFKPQPVSNSIQITERDEQIMLALYQYRFLDSRQIAKLVRSDSDWLLRRIRKLFDHGYIDRPPSQILGRNRPMVYAIADNGIEFLNGKHHVGITKRWRDKNRTVGLFQIEHTLESAEQVITFQRAAYERPATTFLAQQFLLDFVPYQKNGHALALPAKVRWNSVLEDTSIVADAFFGLRHTDKDEVFRYYLLETDRGTEPIDRSDFRQSSIKKKMLTYADIIAKKPHVKRLGIDHFQVLFVTTSEQRIETMQACYENHVRPIRFPVPGSTKRIQISPRYFLFTTKEKLLRSDPFELEWQDASGKIVTLKPK